ncbi:MAG TPA: hypothetical protein PKD19_01915 [Candidatus Saccharibacteria bacterium]|jgi:hypothetical protein|nr:hypothetical protein [Candidatus Saccharibacteria bacterium]HMR38313.1 hypothetical protein [Candidatus Saccharibacteria bacterium]
MSPEQPIAPQNSTVMPEMPNEPPKKKGNKTVLVILVAVVGVIALGAGSFFATQALFAPKTEQETPKTAQKEEEQPVAELTAAGVIDKVKKEWEGIVAEKKQKDSSFDSAVTEGSSAPGETVWTPSYKAEGKDFYVRGDGARVVFSLGYGNDDVQFPRDIDKEVRQKVQALYASLGLVKKETLGIAESGNQVDIYTGNGVVCDISGVASQTHATDASCGDAKKLEALVDKLAPMVKAQAAKEGSSSKGVLMSDGTIENSTVEGYQKATLGMSMAGAPAGGYAALFYKAKDGEWQYFTGTQNYLACSRYNTQDIRNAFKGDLCYDEVAKAEAKVE